MRPLSRTTSDSRRTDELDRYKQDRAHRKFDAVPAVDLLLDLEDCVVVNGGTVKLTVRIGGDLYEVELTKVV